MFKQLMQMKKGLLQLDTWLVAAQKMAADKKFEPASFLTERLVVDQFPLLRQVQMSCDTLKLGASRLTGKEAPKHADDEKSLDDLRARVKSTVAYLDTFTAADFESSPTTHVTTPRWEGKWMTGSDYFVEHVTPNFYFHMTTTYALLRTNGVSIGKKDFLGELSQHAPG
jgi:hypothetical protein